MRRTVAILLAILIVAVVWLFFKHFDVRGIERVRVSPKNVSANSEHLQDSGRTDFAWNHDNSTKKTSIFDHLTRSKPKSNIRKTIRIASFNLQSFGGKKSSNYEVMDMLARILRNFDIVSVQELRSNRPDVMPKLIDHLNSNGRKYDYVVGPRLGPAEVLEQYAFVFDQATVQLDREELYTVEDVHDQMEHEPLVGWFRARGPDAKSAFTFSLVDVHIEPDQARAELDVLDDILYAIRRDGRNEDDVILAGDFGANRGQLGQLGAIPGFVAAIADEPTNTRGTVQRDNVILQLPATEEFNGRAGVFDFMREYNLTLKQALQVSDHLPVWAEFSVYEGGEAGRAATTIAGTQ